MLTQQVFHALSRLDDFSADRGAADAVQDVVSFTDDLMKKKTVSVKKYCFCSLKCAHFFELVKLCNYHQDGFLPFLEIHTEKKKFSWFVTFLLPSPLISVYHSSESHNDLA